jgi:hypothetical protein
MASLRLRVPNIGTLGLALTLASPLIAQSGSDAAQSGAVIYWNAAQCTGNYRPDVYSAHCESGPVAVILDFKTKAYSLARTARLSTSNGGFRPMPNRDRRSRRVRSTGARNVGRRRFGLALAQTLRSFRRNTVRRHRPTTT